MKFEPRPPDPFSEFIAVYFERCRQACPKLTAMTGKWRFEDLIPGLSDFDTRFLAANDTSPEDWAAMSLAVGKVHTDLTRERPEWARILEHLPGINLTFDELQSPLFYSPEFRQWSCYDGDIAAAQAACASFDDGWTARDERHHWQRFAQYWGPYQRGIDPPVNLGPFENKYALHSRYMHYFAPPLQSAVSLALKRTVCGKLEALRLARELFPSPEVIAETLAAVESHYEIPEAYCDDGLAGVEQRLEAYLNSAFASLTAAGPWAKLATARTPADLKQRLAQDEDSPAREFFGRMRFYRLMRGRLQFYAEDIPWFETPWLIRNELSRLGSWACRRPVIAFVRQSLGRCMGFEAALSAIEDAVISRDESAAFLKVCALSDAPIAPGAERARARAVADNFEPVHLALERLGEQMRRAENMRVRCTGSFSTRVEIA